MAQNNKPAAQKPADPTVPAPSNKKMLIGIIAALVIVIAAGAAWFLTKGKSNEHHVEEVKVAPPKNPIFVPLEPFTVNLRSEHNSDQYLQLGLSMKVFEAEFETKIKTNLPEIRSKVLQLLTTKTAAELLTAEGKNKLVKEIMTMSNAVIGVLPPAPVAPVVAVAPTDPAAAQHAPEAASAASAIAAPVHAPAAKPAEAKGIVDVLFTSFIIQ